MAIQDQIIYSYAESLKRADLAAKNAHRGTTLEHDGGTCNFDAALIDFTGWRDADIQKLNQLCDDLVGDKLSSKHWKGCRWLNIQLLGQVFAIIAFMLFFLSFF